MEAGVRGTVRAFAGMCVSVTVFRQCIYCSHVQCAMCNVCSHVVYSNASAVGLIDGADVVCGIEALQVTGSCSSNAPFSAVLVDAVVLRVSTDCLCCC